MLNSTPGDPNADSYFQIADADSYFAARGNTVWAAATEDQKEQAARLGTQYIDNAYRGRWIGITTNQDQALDWPRVDGTRGGFGTLNGMTFGYGTTGYYGYVYPLFDLNGWKIDINTVPQGVIKAAMEAAALVVAGVNLEPMITRSMMLKSFRNKVDVIEEQAEYLAGAGLVNRYMVIEGYLRALALSTPGAMAGVSQLVRA